MWAMLLEAGDQALINVAGLFVWFERRFFRDTGRFRVTSQQAGRIINRQGDFHARRRWARSVVPAANPTWRFRVDQGGEAIRPGRNRISPGLGFGGISKARIICWRISWASWRFARISGFPVRLRMWVAGCAPTDLEQQPVGFLPQRQRLEIQVTSQVAVNADIEFSSPGGTHEAAQPFQILAVGRDLRGDRVGIASGRSRRGWVRLGILGAAVASGGEQQKKARIACKCATSPTSRPAIPNA